MFISYFTLNSYINNHLFTAVIALAIGYLVAAILSLYFVKELLGVRIQILKILKILVSYSILSIFIFIITKLLFSLILIRLLVYGIISISLVFIYMYHSSDEYVYQLRKLLLKISNE